MVEVLLLLLAYALMLDWLLKGSNERGEVVVPVVRQAFLRMLARREGGRGAAGVARRLRRGDPRFGDEFGGRL
jgi:hypothetical protein